MERVLERCRGYIDAVAEEAELREQDRVLGVEEYRIARRENSAVRYVFAFCEFALGIELPSEVFNDETFVRAYNAAVDMVCWSNVSELRNAAVSITDEQSGRLFVQYGTSDGTHWK